MQLLIMKKRLAYCLAVWVVVILVAVVIFSWLSGCINQCPHQEQIHEYKTPPTKNLISLPLKNLTYPFHVLVEKEWYHDMNRLLSKLPTKDVVLLSASEDFLPVLFNWLSAYRNSTSSSLCEVLVLAMDVSIHATLLHYGFASVLINNEDIFLPNVKLVTAFSHIWIKRCTVARILNHLGYNVMMFDLDAVVLKDITAILDHSSLSTSDIVGSIGKYPFYLGREWGFTLCMGVVSFRSTNGTENFWEAVCKIPNKIEDDQVRANQALKDLNIMWRECADGNLCTAQGETITGQRVTLLSHDIVCRSCRQSAKHYYIWHSHSSRTGHSKEKIAKKGHVWFLKEDWRNILEHSVSKGSQLIDQIIRD